MATVKIMTYNIWRGFHSKDHILQRERLEAAQRLVHHEKPNVLALVEACYGGKNSLGNIMDYQSLFGFTHGIWGGYPFFGNKKLDIGGNALLSRYPLDATVVSLPSKSAVSTSISLDDRLLRIDVVHPSASLGDLANVDVLRPLLGTHRTGHYVLTGDFNALSPDDVYEHERLVQELRQFYKDLPLEHIQELLQRNLIRWILTHNLRDAFEDSTKRASTVPTSAKHGRKVVGMRIDYFFVSDTIKVKDAYVLKNDDTEIASDHYPIVGIFEF